MTKHQVSISKLMKGQGFTVLSSVYILSAILVMSYLIIEYCLRDQTDPHSRHVCISQDVL